MKTSNLILGLVTLMCAVGSAVASKVLAPSPTWISGQTTATGNPTTCSTLGNICDPSGATVNCRISIKLGTGITQDTRGFANNVCTTNRLQTGAVGTITKSNLVTVVPYVAN